MEHVSGNVDIRLDPALKEGHLGLAGLEPLLDAHPWLDQNQRPWVLVDWERGPASNRPPRPLEPIGCAAIQPALAAARHHGSAITVGASLFGNRPIVRSVCPSNPQTQLNTGIPWLAPWYSLTRTVRFRGSLAMAPAS